MDDARCSKEVASMMKGQHISWKYKKQSAAILQNVSFEIKTGRITTFMGPSGAGKTTLLKCLANIHAEYEGSIMWNEQDLKTLNPLQRASLIGFVLQQFHLFPHLTALQNCTYALIHTLKIKQKEAEKQALEILDFSIVRRSTAANCHCKSPVSSPKCLAFR
jgi:ABC-type polar amino acid transport system ATPase subunit